MTFHHFDALVKANEFWSMPIDRLNQSLEKNHTKDTLQRAGVSVVFGCPLPQEIMEKIRTLQQVFDRTLAAQQSTVRIVWRTQLEALHFSIYGLIMPDDYRADHSWPLRDQQIQEINNAFHAFKGHTLELQGVGILGMGAISVRVSDSPELEQFRDAIGVIDGVSRERFGSRTKKIVIGRVSPSLAIQDREHIKDTCGALREMVIGTLCIDALEIIHYKNTFLEAEYDRVHLE